MPSLPQPLNGARLIGRIEVHRQFDIEHFPKTDCHVAVAAEIKIYLQCIGKYHQ